MKLEQGEFHGFVIKSASNSQFDDLPGMLGFGRHGDRNLPNFDLRKGREKHNHILAYISGPSP